MELARSNQSMNQTLLRAERTMNQNSNQKVVTPNLMSLVCGRNAGYFNSFDGTILMERS